MASPNGGTVDLSRADWHLLYEDVPVMLCVLDSGRRVQYANRALREALDLGDELLKDRTAGAVLGCIYSLHQPGGCGHATPCGDCPLCRAVCDTLPSGASHRGIEFCPTRECGEARSEAAFLVSTSLLPSAGPPHVLVCFQDVTERKRAEDALRRSRSKQKALMDAIPDPAWLKDKEGRFLAVNAAWCEFFGLHDEDAVGKTAFDFLPADVAAKLWEHDRRVLQSRQPLRYEETLPSNDGRWLWFDTIKTPLFDEHGEVIEISGLARDITEQRQAEAARHENEQRMRMALEVSRSYTFEWDPATDRIVRAGSHSVVLGLPDELGRQDKGERYLRHVHFADRKRLERTVEGLTPAADTYHTEYRIFQENGTPVTLEESARGFFDGQGRLCRLVGVATDITERKRAEETIEQQRLFTEAMLESIHSGIIACDANGVLTVFNRTMREFHGLTESPHTSLNEWGGRYDLYLADGKTVMRTEEIPLFRALQGEKIHDFEMAVIAPQGQVHTVLVSGGPIENRHNRRIGAVVAIHDITERKRIEAALRESQERLTLAVDAAQIGIFDWDVRTSQITCTPQAEVIFGLSPTAGATATHEYREWEGRLHPDDVPSLLDGTRDSSGDHAPYQVEYRVIWPNGSVRWVASRGRAYFDLEGRPIRVLGTVMDVTQRKEIEQELHRLNRLYSTLSELNQAIVRVKSREELFGEVCRIATQTAGFPLAWIGWIDRQTRQVVPVAQAGVKQGYLDHIQIYADDRPEGRGPTGRAAREGRVCVSNDIAADPHMAPWHAAAAARGLRTSAAMPIRFRGELCGALTVYDDETYVVHDKELVLFEEASSAISLALDRLDREAQRKQTEKRLLASEAMLREAQQIALLGSYTLRFPEGTWTASEVVERILDLPADYPHTEEGWTSLVHPDDWPMLHDYLFHHVVAGCRPFDQEFRILRHGDGEIRWLHALGRVELDAAGQPAALCGTVQDVTERKLAEQEKLQIERRLLQSQKLESLGSLAGGLAHDLNNVFTPILTATKLLQSGRPGLDPQTLLAMARSGVERGVEMVRQLLTFAGGGDSPRSAIQLDTLVEEVRQLLVRTSPPSVVVEIRMDDDLWPLSGNGTQLWQVLMNLCINARDAMPNGGTLTITAANHPLTASEASAFRGATSGRYVAIAVADTGTGMSPAVQQQLFESFFTTKRSGKGTGLGLFTSQRIVHQHRGFIQVVSEPDKGSCFKVYLPADLSVHPPAAPPSPRPPSGEPPREPRPASGELILVVDDEPTIRLACRGVLQTLGYRVLTANDGLEALEVYQAHRAEVRAVILDMMMPRLDGSGMLRELRRQPIRVPVIACSGLPTSQRIAAALAAGADRFLAKPYSDEQLAEALQSLLSEDAQPPPLP